MLKDVLDVLIQITVMMNSMLKVQRGELPLDVGRRRPTEAMNAR